MRPVLQQRHCQRFKLKGERSQRGSDRQDRARDQIPVQTSGDAEERHHKLTAHVQDGAGSDQRRFTALMLYGTQRLHDKNDQYRAGQCS